MINFKRISALALSLSLLVTAFAGCSKKEETQTPSPTVSEASKPTKISILTQFYTKTAPDNSNVVEKQIEKDANVELDINWVPSATYTDKLNLQLASGDLTDLTFLMSPHGVNVRNLFSQGAFWDITDIYPNYKNLAAFEAATWDNVKAPDGKNYMIPRPRPTDGGQHVTLYRADLFEEAGIPLPTTADDLYSALTVLKKKYPDYTGFVCSSDGTSIGGEVQAMLDFFVKGFLTSLFKDTPDGLVYSDTLPEMKQGLEFVKKLYDEKLINEDFALLKDRASIINTGKWFAAAGGSVSNNWTHQKEIVKIMPEAKVRAVPAVNGVAYKSAGSFGGYSITKKVSEDKMIKLMEFMDFMHDPQKGGELASYGIKDVHFTMKDGKYSGIQEAIDRDLVGANTYGQIGLVNNKYTRAGVNEADIPADLLEENIKIVDEQAKISIPNPFDMGLISETYDKNISDYNKKSNDIKLKIILGKLPMSDWDKYVEELKGDANISKMQEELTASFNAKTGK